ncbi:hypothetical protein ABIA55_004868 [Pseudomonas frederiksbergensis]
MDSPLVPTSFTHVSTVLQPQSPAPDYVDIPVFDTFSRLDSTRTKAMRRNGKRTELRNQTFRSNARKLAYKMFVKDIAPQASKFDESALKFDPITSAAIDACHLWEGAAIYPWDKIQDWKCKDDKGLDLAIWYEQKLCGLCYATPRRSTICVKVILLQGHPDKMHPLRGWIAPMALSVTDVYARMLGCKEIEIQDPDPNVVFYYQQLGFVFDQTGRLVIYLDGQ